MIVNADKKKGEKKTQQQQQQNRFIYRTKSQPEKKKKKNQKKHEKQINNNTKSRIDKEQTKREPHQNKTAAITRKGYTPQNMKSIKGKYLVGSN